MCIQVGATLLLETLLLFLFFPLSQVLRDLESLLVFLNAHWYHAHDWLEVASFQYRDRCTLFCFLPSFLLDMHHLEIILRVDYLACLPTIATIRETSEVYGVQVGVGGGHAQEHILVRSLD